ncbi:MAG: hypothetical protein ACXVW2_05825 [Nocardioidaceae bacterium]
MGLGTGAGFFAVGAILYWAVDINLPYVDDDSVGLILMIVGAVVAVASLLARMPRAPYGAGRGSGAAASVESALVTGLVLIGAGAALVWAINVDLPFVSDNALGVILMVAGVVYMAATLAMHHQRSQTRNVVEYRS